MLRTYLKKILSLQGQEFFHIIFFRQLQVETGWGTNQEGSEGKKLATEQTLMESSKMEGIPVDIFRSGGREEGQGP
jgi:hypothetical protein